MHPVFFSVASQDIKVAESVWGQFAANDIYLYSKSGKEGAWFWDEIEAELSQAGLIVIFWSAHFLASESTKRELAFAAERFSASAHLHEALIVRLDETPIMGSSDTSLEHEIVYKSFRVFTANVRAMDPTKDVGTIVSRVDQLLSRISAGSLPPFFQRPSVINEFRDRSKALKQKTFPVVWVEGLNGNGRRTMIREAYRSFSQTALPLEVSLIDIQLPKQFVLQLASEGLNANKASLDAINDNELYDTPEGVAEIISKIVRERNRYLVISQDWLDRRPTGAPEWLLHVFGMFIPENRPKVFL